MSKGFGNVKNTRQKFHFYYLPCLNPNRNVMGGLLKTLDKVKIGDVFEMWDFPVEVVEAPNCESKYEPNLNKLPMLKVRLINKNESTNIHKVAEIRVTNTI